MPNQLGQPGASRRWRATRAGVYGCLPARERDPQKPLAWDASRAQNLFSSFELRLALQTVAASVVSAGRISLRVVAKKRTIIAVERCGCDA